VPTLASLGLGLLTLCRRLRASALLRRAAEQSLAAPPLPTHGEHKEEAEQRHEDARHQLDHQRVDPEVHDKSGNK